MTTAIPVEARRGFQAFSLPKAVLAALHRAQYHHPTPIQAAVLPLALDENDVIGQAQTGTGKTAAFLLPFLSTWSGDEENGPQALILAPTRELVVQVCEEARKLTPHRECRCTPIYGGQSFRGQVLALRAGSALVVGTPGRILDHLARGTLSLAGVRYVVLDEADRMLDIGFRPDIERIMRRCPTKRQTLLLSATLPAPVLRLAQHYMSDPVHINLSPDKVVVEKIRQHYITVDEAKKYDLLLRVVDREKPRQCIIFCRRRVDAHRVYKQLREHRQRVAAMHGDLSQDLRERIMRAFRDGRVVYLVATDVVGRGIDVTNISHIINYDLPDDPENYVHRIGRTGRMGADGVAITFVTPDQGKELTAIEMLVNCEISHMHIPGFRAFIPKKPTADGQTAHKPTTPVFGRQQRRYRRGL